MACSLANQLAILTGKCTAILTALLSGMLTGNDYLMAILTAICIALFCGNPYCNTFKPTLSNIVNSFKSPASRYGSRKIFGERMNYISKISNK